MTSYRRKRQVDETKASNHQMCRKEEKLQIRKGKGMEGEGPKGWKREGGGRMREGREGSKE